jgi:hypothetical protein
MTHSCWINSYLAACQPAVLSSCWGTLAWAVVDVRLLWCQCWNGLLHTVRSAASGSCSPAPSRCPCIQ